MAMVYQKPFRLLCLFAAYAAPVAMSYRMVSEAGWHQSDVILLSCASGQARARSCQHCGCERLPVSFDCWIWGEQGLLVLWTDEQQPGTNRNQHCDTCIGCLLVPWTDEQQSGTDRILHTCIGDGLHKPYAEFAQVSKQQIPA